MMNTEQIEEWIEKLRNSEKAVIVEGKKDKYALESFGIKNVFMLNKKPIYEMVEEVSALYERCVILTDLDKEGKKLYGKLSSALQHHGVEIDNYFREFLLKNTKIRQIEGLVVYSP